MGVNGKIRNYDYAKRENLIYNKARWRTKKLIGEALKRFEKAGLDLAHLEIKKIKKAQARKFYGHLKTKLHPKIFDNIIEYMTSDKVVIGIVEGKNAASKVREICGPTNPKVAPKGTLRGDFGEDDLTVRAKQLKATRNIIHSSESHKHAKNEFKILNKK
jgi:nucleoside-diphosphate kinase